MTGSRGENKAKKPKSGRHANYPHGGMEVNKHETNDVARRQQGRKQGETMVKDAYQGVCMKMARGEIERESETFA